MHVLLLVLVLLSAATTPARAQSPGAAQPASFEREPFLVELAEKGQRERLDRLLSHHLNPTPSSLLAFLQSGFPPSTLSGKLPAQAGPRTDVYNDAIAELGFNRVAAAVPTLVEILDGRVPPGLEQVLSIDLEPLPLDRSDVVRRDMLAIVRLNALVALGYIGDPSASGSILRAMEREPGGAFVTEGAIALALLGDGNGLGALSPLTQDPRSENLPGVFEAIYVVTGRNYGLTRNTAIPRREQLIREHAQWLRGEGAVFEPSRSLVLRRRLVGPLEPELPLEDLRGALRATRDVDNFDRRYAGRERMRSLGKSAAPQLRAIVEDEMEDIDIRRAAMTFYAAAEPSEARRVLRRVERDSVDPLIREVAASLERSIEQELKNERR